MKRNLRLIGYSKIGFIILIAISVGCLSYTGTVLKTNYVLKNELQHEKLKSERILSEKLQLEKEIAKLKGRKEVAESP